jgi:hypothetical protein
MNLRKLTAVMLSLTVTVLFTSAFLSDNGRAGKTGSPGELTCNDCHGDYAPNTGGGTITLTGVSGTYTPGTTYNLSLTISRTGSTVFGLGVEALNSGNANAGTWVITNSAETQLKSATVSGISRQSVVHQLDGGATSNSHTFNFNWTAPAAGTGTVTMYYSGIAGDHDGNETGDYTYNSSLVLTEAGGCPVPAQPGAITGATAVCSGTSQTYSIAAVANTTDYIWTLPAGWTGTSTSTSITATTNGTSGNVSVVAHNACGSSQARTLAVTSSAAVNPTISISTTAANPICAGTNVTFNSSQTNGGASPSYQWKLNGANVGTNSASYSNAALANGDVVSCVMTSNASCVTSATATSNSLTMTIVSSVSPGVTIAANPGTTICSGTNVTFTATPTNGGAAPSYQWKLNGANVGTNSATYSNAALANGDVVTCVMTSNASCVTAASATSNALTILVTTGLNPAVSIAANPGNSICAGTNVTFTATPTNGGAAPAYQWKLNGANVGTNSVTYSNAGLANGDIVSCVMTSNASCVSTATATSNTITIAIVTSVSPAINIAAAPSSTICSGETVNFNATATNGGSAPSYQWILNGSNVGTNSTSYTNFSLNNGDVVSCVLTSNASCITSPTANSNAITITVNPTVTPTVSITANPGNTICSGTNVDFTATTTNSGVAPSYQWTVNGTMVGTNSATFSSSTLANGDVVVCTIITNVLCSTTSQAVSNPITMIVNGTTAPAVSIAADPGNTICTGSNVIFTATPTNGGTAPSYQWTVNGSNVGSNSVTYSSNTLVDGDQVQCTMTSNSACATTSTATSSVITMIVNSNFVPTINAGGPTTFCHGGSVVLTASAGSDYVWSPGGETTQSITVGSAGNYSVQVTSGSCTGTSVDAIVTVNPLPQVSLAAFAPMCSTDAAITLSGGSPVGGNYSGTGVANGMFDPAVSGVGTFTITYSYSDANTCTGEATSSIIVTNCGSGCTQAPDMPHWIHGDWSIGCLQSGVSYFVANDTNAASYNWTLPAGATIASNNGNSITVDFDSTFAGGDLCVTATNACGTSPQRCIYIHQARMQISHINGPFIICPDNLIAQFQISPVPNAVSYNWIAGGGAVVTANGNSASIDFTNAVGQFLNITVQVIDSCGQMKSRSTWVRMRNDCDWHDHHEGHDDDRLSSSNGTMDFGIYPNPSNGAFAIQMNALQSSNAVITITDLLGKIQMVLNQVISEGNNTIDVNATALVNGIYFVKVELPGSDTTISRIVIEN